MTAASCQLAANRNGPGNTMGHLQQAGRDSRPLELCMTIPSIRTNDRDIILQNHKHHHSVSPQERKNWPLDKVGLRPRGDMSEKQWPQVLLSMVGSMRSIPTGCSSCGDCRAGIRKASSSSAAQLWSPDGRRLGSKSPCSGTLRVTDFMLQLFTKQQGIFHFIFYGAGQWAWGLMRARQVPHHWATYSALDFIWMCVCMIKDE